MKEKILDILIDNLTMDEALSSIDELICSKNKAMVVTPNVDHIVKMQNDVVFKELYSKADLILADGMPIVWLSRLLGKPLKQRVTGADLFPLLCKRSAEKGYKLFFLGGREGVAQKAKENLESKYEGLNICGHYCPPFGFESDAEELNRINEAINDVKPDVLFVGLGAPKQEKWFYENKDSIDIKVFIGVGAAFDFQAGNLKRAPVLLQNLGLEWLYRVVKEPKRLFKRYFVDSRIFFSLAIEEVVDHVSKRKKSTF